MVRLARPPDAPQGLLLHLACRCQRNQPWNLRRVQAHEAATAMTNALPLAPLCTRAQRQLFAAGAGELGDGRVVFAWSPRGNFLAAAGNKASGAKPHACSRQRNEAGEHACGSGQV